MTPKAQAGTESSPHGPIRLEPGGTGDGVVFSWNGREVEARVTDTVASALIAAGERIFTTHPSTNEARGGFCFVGRCSDCLVVIDGQPGVFACRTPVRAGMRVERQIGHGHWGEAPE